MKKILILGGNRFFGRHLAQQLVVDGHYVTLLNRGSIDDGFGPQVKRLVANRKDETSLAHAVAGKYWDIVFDQICFTAQDAAMACRIFKGKADRYVVTSSESVFNDGENQKEINFDPANYKFTTDADPLKDYQEAKRQVEVVFTKEKSFSLSIPRPSLVVGVDDYSKRLTWHLERVRDGKPIFLPNPQISNDFIRSDQAGQALKVIGFSNQEGPINMTTPGAVPILKLLKLCEEKTGRKAILADQEEGDNHSPYGATNTLTMNTDLLASLGCRLESSLAWMPSLIQQL